MNIFELALLAAIVAVGWFAGTVLYGMFGFAGAVMGGFVGVVTAVTAWVMLSGRLDSRRRSKMSK
jgi:hypothetical protein